MFSRQTSGQLQRVLERWQPAASPADGQRARANGLLLRTVCVASKALCSEVRLTRAHLHERSRLSDCTLDLRFADTYFRSQKGWLGQGGASLHPKTVVGLEILRDPAEADRLLAYLTQRRLVGPGAPGWVHSETFRESLRGLRQINLALLPTGEAHLCQLLRLHRAESIRSRLFTQYIVQQRHEELGLNRTLVRCSAQGSKLAWMKTSLEQQQARLRDDIAWAQTEREVLPSRRQANAFLAREVTGPDPLLPRFCTRLHPGELSLQIYPPPTTTFGDDVATLLPSYVGPPSPQPWRCMPA